jgi:Conserved TM helix
VIVFSIHSSVNHGFVVFFGWVPRVVGFLAVLLIGYIVAKVVGGLVFRLTHRAGLDRTVHSGAGGNLIQRAVPSPSRLLGKITFWAIFLGALSIAASVLGIKALTAFVGAVWAYIPNVIAALVIFLIAAAIAGAVVALVKRVMGDAALGKIVATAVPIIVMTIAIFMILVQLKIAIQIVTITYAAIWGAIALAAALAFGLGGREVAGQMLEGAYQKGQENKEQYKQELAQAKERAKKEAEQARHDAQASGPGASTRLRAEPGQ